MAEANKGGAMSLVLVLLVILIAVGYCASIADNTGHSGSSTKIKSTVSEYRVDGDWIGCLTREQKGKLTSYSVQNDKEAYMREFGIGLIEGFCTMFKDGEIVYLMDTAIFSGLVCVRRKGEINTYWTNTEAIKQ
jgi:hypothetical protein